MPWHCYTAVSYTHLETIYRPVYDFSIHNRVPETVKVEPKKVILIEGILIFENKELRDLMDIKIFVDADADERLMRRMIRDMKYLSLIHI